jgi:hypothetical protein
MRSGLDFLVAGSGCQRLQAAEELRRRGRAEHRGRDVAHLPGLAAGQVELQRHVALAARVVRRLRVGATDREARDHRHRLAAEGRRGGQANGPSALPTNSPTAQRPLAPERRKPSNLPPRRSKASTGPGVDHDAGQPHDGDEHVERHPELAEFLDRRRAERALRPAELPAARCSTVCSATIRRASSASSAAMAASGCSTPTGYCSARRRGWTWRGLVASTLNISDADWQAQRYHLLTRELGPAGGGAAVVNQGELRSTWGGRVMLIGGAGGVRNDGLIEAPGGRSCWRQARAWSSPTARCRTLRCASARPRARC